MNPQQRAGPCSCDVCEMLAKLDVEYYKAVMHILAAAVEASEVRAMFADLRAKFTKKGGEKNEQR